MKNFGFKLERHCVQNFKSFGSVQEFRIKPVTLIFGANNAGKSSLIHSLLFPQQMLKQYSADVRNFKSGNSQIDLGGLNQILHNQSNGKIQIGQDVISNASLSKRDGYNYNCFKSIEEFDLSLGLILTGTISWQIEIDVLNYSTPYITKLELSIKDPILKEFFFGNHKKKYPDTTLIKLKQKNTNSPILNLEAFDNKTPILALISDYLSNELFSKKFESLKSIFEKIELKIPADNFNRFETIIDDSDTSGILSSFISLNIIDPIKNIVEGTEDFNVLGPVRNIPDRIISDDIQHKGWESNTFYSSLLNKQYPESSKMALERLNQVLKSDKYLGLDYEFIIEDYSSNLSSSRSFRNLALRNTKNGHLLSLSDVGTGLSQLLPIISEMILGKNSHLIIQQPELHLHPGLQSKFGSLVCETRRIDKKFDGPDVPPKLKRNVVIETHSEHIIKSVQLEVTKYTVSDGEEGISKDDVAILYASNENGETKIREIGIDETGSFTEPWPDNFFELSSDLTMERLKNSYKSKN